MIRILKQRTVSDGKAPYLLMQQRFASIPALFNEVDSFLAKLPAGEDYNLHYSQAFWEEPREFIEQGVVCFDIDHINMDRISEYHEIVLEVLGVQYNTTAIINSGHGLHYVIALNQPIASLEELNALKPSYKYVCYKIQSALKKKDLAADVDNAIFRDKATLRLPGTWNKKKNMDDVRCEFIQPKLAFTDFSLKSLAGDVELSKEEYINTQTIKRYSDPDIEGVQEGCEFLKNCKQNQNTVKEPAWYAMLSITSRLGDNGRELSHQYSKDYKHYDERETDLKIDQALAAPGPRTCSNINQLWDGCKACKYRDKVTSPIQIKSPSYITTEKTGFHFVKNDQLGNPRVGKPDFEGLRRFFEKKYPYFCFQDSNIMYIFNGTHYVMFSDIQIEAFAQKHFIPVANTSKTREFKQLAYRNNIKTPDWMKYSTEGKINLKNGVYDIKKDKLIPHSPDYGFTYVLDYAYDPKAECPKFDKFMEDVTVAREDLINVLLEYFGFVVAGHRMNPAKALVLIGEGHNGKSTLLDILESLVGTANKSSITLEDLKKDSFRFLMINKLVNISEETPSKSLMDSSVFKNLVSGGSMVVRMYYKQPYDIRNRTKLIFACNEMPTVTDATKGMFRRLLIVPFNAEFEGSNDDPFMKEKVSMELPGIFNKVMEHYKHFCKTNSFSDSVYVRESLEQYRQEVDTVYCWYDECAELKPIEQCGEKDFVDNMKLYNHYKYFTEERQKRPIAYNKFCKRMRQIVRSPERFKRMGKRKTSVMIGINILEEDSF